MSQLDEKLQKYSREHWLGLDCLQEKVSNMAMSQKDLASLGLQVQSLHEQCEAFELILKNKKTQDSHIPSRKGALAP